jgi:hypothetical protein
VKDKAEVIAPLAKSLLLSSSGAENKMTMEAVLVTLGGDGLMIARRGSEVDGPLIVPQNQRRARADAFSMIHYPACRMDEIVSVSGAGDW